MPRARATLGAALAYFGLVFGAGFALGVLRTLFVAPRLGARAAELLEMPLMLLLIVVAARWIVRQRAAAQALFDRDPVAGVAYALALLAFAAMPAWMASRIRQR